MPTTSSPTITPVYKVETWDLSGNDGGCVTICQAIHGKKNIATREECEFAASLNGKGFTLAQDYSGPNTGNWNQPPGCFAQSDKNTYIWNYYNSQHCKGELFSKWYYFIKIIF